MVDPASGKNPLYNVLNAFAMYDREVGYCQGINYIVAMLLKQLENEEDSFYCLVHIMHVHDWRGCFDLQLVKLAQMKNFLECVLETAWPDVYNHIKEECTFGVSDCFQNTISTIFIYESPELIARQFFEVFLLDGEQVIFTVILKMIEIKEKKILSIFEHDILSYLRS
jgi:hypothetical protein